MLHTANNWILFMVSILFAYNYQVSEATSLGLEAKWQNVHALCSMDDEPSTITVLGQEVAMVEEFVYPGSVVQLLSSPDISCHNAITRVAMQKLDNQNWK